MQRPTSVTVFGVLNIVLSVLGLFGIASMILVAFALPADPELFQVEPWADTWSRINLVWAALAALVLLVSGIGLLSLKPWARLTAIGYSIASLSMNGIALVVHWIYFVRPVLAGGPETERLVFAAMVGLAGACIGPVYPLLLWYYMTRRHVVAAFGGIPVAFADAPWVSGALPPAGAHDASNPYLAPRTDTTHPLGAGEVPSAAESIIEAFVPSKNGPALASYYLGLLALFPCLGFPVGVAAVYYGVRGLKRVRAHPEVRGGAHAWVGIVCGSLFGLFNFVLVALLVIGGVAAAINP